MAQFSSTFLDEILARTDLVELIARHVDLKPSGSNMMGLCPFHHEKTPSFSVSMDKQIYYCFGCGKGGNAYRYLMEHDGHTFPEAVEMLANRAGIAMPTRRAVNPHEEAKEKAGLALLQQVSDIFHRTLSSHQGEKAMDYFKQRQLPITIINRYQLGFAPAGYGFMQQCFGADQQAIEQLERVGVLIKNERGYADRFRDRVIFPIRNAKGQVVGFGGRVFGEGEPKYLNSPETDFYHKSDLLYGLSEHRDAIRKDKTLVVVEGYMDVLAMAGFDLPYGLAPLGTAITAQQLQMILRLHHAPIFCFDGDRAGKQAAWRAIERMLPILKAEHSPKFLYLPDGADPDSMLQDEGKEAFSHRLHQDSRPILETWIKGLKNIGGDGAEGRARMAKKADQMLSQMTDPYLKQAWQSEVEKASGVAMVAQKSTNFTPLPRATMRTKTQRPPMVTPMKHDQFMSAILQKPKRIRELPEDGFEFFIDSDPYQSLYTRAFSLAGDEDNTLNIAAQLMREFPDNQDIARWVNLPTVEDDEFQMLLLDMHISYLHGLRSRAEGLSVIIKLNDELKALREQQSQLKINTAKKQ